jgi:uncharacterized protein YabN with tetrapyrrole methylase and pyrophosphatase domain
MKTITLLLVLAFCLVSIGCNRHTEEVKTFINERSEVVAQMCTRMDASPNAAGIDDARKTFDARKADLKAKWDAIKKANVSFDLNTTIMKSNVFDNNMLAAIREKNAFQMSYDKAGIPKGVSWDKGVEEKFYALLKDFHSTFE